MRAADAAGDGQLRAWILSIHAMQAAYTNRHQDVIDLTNAGLAGAGQQAPPPPSSWRHCRPELMPIFVTERPPRPLWHAPDRR
jgi:hypothetical protein